MARHTHGDRADMYGLAHRPDHYDRVAWLGAPLHRKVVADVAGAGLPAGALVVDIGTGPGRVPRRIAAADPHLRVEGVDLAEEMVAYAAAAARADGLGEDRLRFAVADVAALPYADASVDLVISSVSLHHWEQPAAGLAEIRRVLRPGGRAWVYDLRHVLRREEPAAGGEGVDVRRERLWGGPVGWLVPLGRLALSRRP
jgi:ubiquinone/menaquinone biosynthesis C-methylase UbiE